MKKQPKKHHNVSKKNKTLNGYSDYSEKVIPQSPECYIFDLEDHKALKNQTLFQKIKNFIKEKFL